MSTNKVLEELRGGHKEISQLRTRLKERGMNEKVIEETLHSLQTDGKISSYFDIETGWTMWQIGRG